jgi:hypothetical protein
MPPGIAASVAIAGRFAVTLGAIAPSALVTRGGTV